MEGKRFIVSHALAIGLSAVAPVGTLAADVLKGPARVIDGDTLDVAGTRVRLADIDAPERGQAAGPAATAFLRELIHGRQVTCQSNEWGHYGRRIAVCSVSGRDLNATMVFGGHAAVRLRYGNTYADLQAEARAGRRGLWAADDPVMPWAFRETRKTAVASGGPATSDCRIKGNIGAGGARIYHVPSSPWYGRTRISQARGERMFCTEADARAAGWRAPRG